MLPTFTQYFENEKKEKSGVILEGTGSNRKGIIVCVRGENILSKARGPRSPTTLRLS
jgi:hypothetical protein